MNSFDLDPLRYNIILLFFDENRKRRFLTILPLRNNVWHDVISYNTATQVSNMFLTGPTAKDGGNYTPLQWEANDTMI